MERKAWLADTNSALRANSSATAEEGGGREVRGIYMLLRDVWCCILVGALWGTTNVFLGKGAGAKHDSLVGTLTNWRFVLPFAANQAGSALYFWLLGSSTADVSLALPVCNSLTFVFTAATGHLLGERPSPGGVARTLVGTALVAAGAALCVLAADTD